MPEDTRPGDGDTTDVPTDEHDHHVRAPWEDRLATDRDWPDADRDDQDDADVVEADDVDPDEILAELEALADADQPNNPHPDE